MHHIELAWTLAEAADHCMSGAERFDVYLALGAGEEDGAIQLLVPVVVRERIALPKNVVASLHAWLEAYRDADHEFRAMLARIEPSPEPSAPVAAPPPHYLPMGSAYQEHRLRPETG